MAASSAYELVHTGELAAKPIGRPWRPGLLRQLPWTGLLALLIGFGCGVAALTIALVSNGKALDYWRVYSYSVQPTVLLAVLVTFTNALLGYAFASGITIFWWLSALNGRTLRQLHASQSRSDSLVAALTLRPVVNTVTIASMLTVLLLMDQPLFQRGVRVISQSSEESRNMSIMISSSPLQRGATGVFPDHSPTARPELFHPLYAQVVRQYQNRDPIQFALPGCKGRCDFDVISTGWEVDCIEWETPYHMMDSSHYQVFYHYKNKTQYRGPPRIQPVFSVNITYHPGFYEEGPPYKLYDSFHIDTSVMYKATPGVNGTMRWRNCTLSEALIKYPVEVSNDTLRLRAMSSETNRTTHQVLRSEEISGQYDYPSTLGGIWRAMNNQFAAQANVTFVAGWTSISTQDIAANTYLQSPSNSTLDSIDYNFTWSDPTDDMISMAHELTLRAAIATTNTLVVIDWMDLDSPNLLTYAQPEVGWPNLTLVNRTVDQESEVAMFFDETVYEIQPSWLTGAFVLIVITCLSIMPTYWGWWRLGRPVSMSPLEIAKAFDAPLMREADPNGTVGDHLRTVGDTRVRYRHRASVAEHSESDATEQPSYQARVDSNLPTSVVEPESSENVGPDRLSSSNGNAPNMPVIGPVRLDQGDDDIELQAVHPGTVHPGTGTVTEVQSGWTTGPSVVSFDPSINNSETRGDLSSDQALENATTSSHIHTRMEMKLKFVKD